MKEYTFHRFSFLDREYEYGLIFSLCDIYSINWYDLYQPGSGWHETYLPPIHDWCHNFGRDRVLVAGTHFHFKNREDMNWFLLRWG